MKRSNRLLALFLTGLTLLQPNLIFAQDYHENVNFKKNPIIEPLNNKYYNTTVSGKETFVTRIDVTEKMIRDAQTTSIVVGVVSGLLGLAYPSALLAVTGMGYSVGNHFSSMGVPGTISIYRTKVISYSVNRLTGQRKMIGEKWKLRFVERTNGGSVKTTTNTIKIK